MFSLRPVIAQRAVTKICTRCLLTVRPISTRTCRTLKPNSLTSSQRLLIARNSRARFFASKSTADTIIEEIQDQYSTAKDEFEIATEETEKQTTYGQADRDAAREELNKLKEMYEDALRTEDGEEVKKRVGGRIRELDEAVKALEESVQEGGH
jgi:predicted RNA-binding protein with PIN domain